MRHLAMLLVRIVRKIGILRVISWSPLLRIGILSKSDIIDIQSERLSISLMFKSSRFYICTLLSVYEFGSDIWS